jgi:hypothetical protein
MKKDIYYNIALVSLVTLAIYFTGCGTKPEFDKLIPFQSEENGNWGYINFNGKKVIENSFSSAPSLFYEGIAVVVNKDSTYDFIDNAGNDFGKNFKSVTYFNGGVACVVEKDQNPKIIDKDLKVISILDSVEQIFCFSEGLACFQDKNGKWGFLNSDGKVVIKAQFDGASSFSEGLALVEKKVKEVQDTLKKDKSKKTINPVSADKETIHKGFIDKKGNEVIGFSDRFYALSSFHDGLAAYSDGGEYGWGFINTRGDKVIRSNPDWKNVTHFKDGYASVRIDNRWGLINKDGEIIIHPKYDSPLYFSNGLAYIELSSGEVGFINYDDEIEIEPDFKEVAMSFYSNRAIVKNKKGFFDIIDKEGECINKLDIYNVSLYFNSSNMVKSDFFDIEPVIDSVFKGLTIKSINGISITSTVSDVFKSFKLSEDALPQNSYVKELSLPIVVKDDLKIFKTIGFSGYVSDPIQKRVSDGWWTYMETVGYKPNIKSLATFISTEITLQGKTSGKSDKLVQGMIKMLKSENFKITEEDKSHKTVVLSSPGGELKINIFSGIDNVNVTIYFVEKQDEAIK